MHTIDRKGFSALRVLGGLLPSIAAHALKLIAVLLLDDHAENRCLRHFIIIAAAPIYRVVCSVLLNRNGSRKISCLCHLCAIEHLLHCHPIGVGRFAVNRQVQTVLQVGNRKRLFVGGEISRHGLPFPCRPVIYNQAVRNGQIDHNIVMLRGGISVASIFAYCCCSPVKRNRGLRTEVGTILAYQSNLDRLLCLFRRFHLDPGVHVDRRHGIGIPRVGRSVIVFHQNAFTICTGIDFPPRDHPARRRSCRDPNFLERAEILCRSSRCHRRRGRVENISLCPRIR